MLPIFKIHITYTHFRPYKIIVRYKSTIMAKL